MSARSGEMVSGCRR